MLSEVELGEAPREENGVDALAGVEALKVGGVKSIALPSPFLGLAL